MAQSSDDLIKEMFIKIGDINDLKLRIFRSDNTSDQKLWVDGGLSFGNEDLRYGSCDAGWYVEKEWTDTLTKRKSDFKPVVLVEGTDCLNTGSSGNAQYQRFFHCLGPVICGVIGVYYLRKGILKLRYDIMKAALNASKVHNTAYLVITDISYLQKLIRLLGNNKKEEVNKLLSKIQKNMLSYFNETFLTKDKGDLKIYYEKRSIIQTKEGDWIKYAGRNYRNFTESSQRAGHIALGEFLMTKYILNKRFYYLFPRMLPDEKEKLDKRMQKNGNL
jgi:hypothetical protein